MPMINDNGKVAGGDITVEVAIRVRGQYGLVLASASRDELLPGSEDVDVLLAIGPAALKRLTDAARQTVVTQIGSLEQSAQARRIDVPS